MHHTAKNKSLIQPFYWLVQLHEFQFSLSIVIEDVVATCMHVIIT